jgi:hypothetical protein
MHLATRQVVGRYPFGALDEYLGQGKNRNSITTFPEADYTTIAQPFPRRSGAFPDETPNMYLLW